MLFLGAIRRHGKAFSYCGGPCKVALAYPRPGYRTPTETGVSATNCSKSQLTTTAGSLCS